MGECFLVDTTIVNYHFGYHLGNQLTSMHEPIAAASLQWKLFKRKLLVLNFAEDV